MPFDPAAIDALIQRRKQSGLNSVGLAVPIPSASPVTPGSLEPLPTVELPGQATSQDQSNRRLQQVYDRLGIIDNISKDRYAAPSRDYLSKAEDLMFRSNQINQQAQILRLQNATSGINFGGGGGRGVKQTKVPGNSSLARFIHAISGKESGGNYGAVNHSSGALGKYQIMPGNIPGWSREALGHSISTSKFLSSPKLQEQIARYKLTQYYKKWGPAGAASAWYSGSPTKWKTSTGSQGAYPSIHNYVMSILHAIGAK